MSFVPHSPEDRREMLRAVGLASVEELYAEVPEGLRIDGELDLPEALSEWEAVRVLRGLAAENHELVSFAGAGIYDHHVPAAVDHLLRRSEFYTAYTPYQPEVAQGTLQAIYEFQTMVCELTGMEVANASIYDGATSAGEAALMALSVTGREEVLVAGHVHPLYRSVVASYMRGLGSAVRHLEPSADGRADAGDLEAALSDRTACVLVQYPNFLGQIEELAPLARAAHDAGALLVVAADPVSLALIRPPGELGADIVVGEGQPFGNPMSYGGPALGLYAGRRQHIRRMPGRIAAATVDEEDRRGYVLTLQTREQQIRRERATSNICTNQGLNALAATLYLALVGRRGLRQVAETSLHNAHYARERLADAPGVRLLHPGTPVIREFAVRTERPSEEILREGARKGILPGVSLSRFPEMGLPDGLLLAFTEKRSREEIDRLVELVAS